MRGQSLHRLIAVTIVQVLTCFSFQSPGISSVGAQTGEQRTLGLKATSVTALPASQKRFALIVGIDQYEDPQINKLQGAANDAKLLADALIRYAGFPKDQVKLLTSDQPGDRPTRGNILRRLSNLCSAIPKDGLLLVSFAGHGIERRGRAYLLPTDAQVSGDLALLEETAIPVETPTKWIRDAGVNQVILILDACRNNPEAGRGDSGQPLSEAYMRGFNFDTRNSDITAFITLYAAEVGQVAYEYTEKKQGYFTWALIEGLSGRAANEKGEVTLAALVNYVRDVVPRRVGIELGQGRRQRPYVVMEGYKPEELVMAVTPIAVASKERPSESNATTTVPDLSRLIKNLHLPHWLEKLTTNPLLPGIGMAGIKIGDSEESVVARLGRPNRIDKTFGRLRDEKTQSIPKSTKGQLLHYSLMYENDGIFLGVYTTPDRHLVKSFRVSDRSFNQKGYIPGTTQGATIGITEEKLRQVMGSPLRSFQHSTCPSGNTTSWFYNGISFMVCEKDKSVYLIDIP